MVENKTTKQNQTNIEKRERCLNYAEKNKHIIKIQKKLKSCEMLNKQ
jgi:hypothetical protein